MDIYSMISERLSSLMLLKNINSDILGKAININGVTIRKWINQSSQMRLRNLIKLAKYFDVKLDYFIGQ